VNTKENKETEDRSIKTNRHTETTQTYIDARTDLKRRIKRRRRKKEILKQEDDRGDKEKIKSCVKRNHR